MLVFVSNFDNIGITVLVNIILFSVKTIMVNVNALIFNDGRLKCGGA